MLPQPPRPTLFPYTTLFRSCESSSGACFCRSRNERTTRSDRFESTWRTRTELQASARSSRSEEHTSELQSLRHLVCRLLLEKKNEPQDHADHIQDLPLLRPC